MTSYILILASLRRLRDIRHHKKWLIIFYVIIIFPYLSYYLVLIPIDNNVFSQFWNFLIIALFFGAHISAILFIPLLFFFLFMLVKIFTKGNPDENEYGLPPKGFDFNTMITDANYLKAKGIENAHAFLMEKDKEQFEQINVLR